MAQEEEAEIPLRVEIRQAAYREEAKGEEQSQEQGAQVGMKALKHEYSCQLR